MKKNKNVIIYKEAIFDKVSQKYIIYTSIWIYELNIDLDVFFERLKNLPSVTSELFYDLETLKVLKYISW